MPPAALLAGATIVVSGGLLFATALVLPHLLWASWTLLPNRAAEAAGLAWAMLVGGGAALAAAWLARPRDAANDNALVPARVSDAWAPVPPDERL